MNDNPNANAAPDLKPYMTKVGGKDYLLVQGRVVWLEQTVERYSIQTEVVELTAQRCVCKVDVMLYGDDEHTFVRQASAIGSETPQDFTDYIEKAGTKALGRALALLGFGTQFAHLEFGNEAEAGRIVDAPVGGGMIERAAHALAQRQATNHAPAQPSNGNGQRPIAPGPRVPGGASEKQVWLITKLAKEKGLDEVMFHAKLADWAQVGSLDDLSSGKASAVIDRLQNYKPESIDDLPF